MNYDVIGDIHGHAEVLAALLRKLGYRERGGAWRHPERTAIFVGDFIDRGPQQLEAVRIVRGMVDSGAALAVMGNHEFNAIGWSMADPRKPGEYLRPHKPQYYATHRAFLEAAKDHPAAAKSILAWFRTLPLWLELPELRVVHACWSAQAMAQLAPKLDADHRLLPDAVGEVCRRDSAEYRAASILMKGLEVRLPDGIQVRIAGLPRGEARTRWWDAGAATLPRAAILDGDDRTVLPDIPVPAEVRPGYRGDRPVFIGHYWMHGHAAPLAQRVACVDYSAGLGGPLVAYRWEGERDLDPAHFVVVGGSARGRVHGIV